MINSRHEERVAGAAAVEMALLLPLLVALVFGIIEFGLAFNRQQSFNAAAREAGRLLSVGYSLSDAEPVAKSQVSGTVNPDDVDVNVVQGCTGTSTPSDPDLLEVEVLLVNNIDRYQLRIPFIASAENRFRSTATFRCEGAP